MGEFEDKLLKERYCIGNESSWKDVVQRVANAIAADATEQKMFYELMINKDFIPNSPTLMNAGTDNGQLSACFVLPVPDSIEGIFEAVKNAALVHKTGGGTGFSFTGLRPSGSVVKSTNGVASGVVSFMQVFDSATDAIKQGGKRRGANMGVLEYTHPEILSFIKCKTVEGTIKNFNISVMVDDAFMEEIIDLKKRGLGNKTSEILDAIVDGIYNNGEPGVLFKDTINDFNPTPHLGPMIATNPCGEQPLLPNESCNLGSINLSNFVKDGGIIDYLRLATTVRGAVIFLDNVIINNKYPLQAIKEATLNTRKIGLGVMGFHDMLIKLGIPYDDVEALRIAEDVMGFISKTANDESRKLAINRGTYPACKATEGYRNATRTTIAPTGTISILANVSSGIEPVFSWAYIRKDTLGEHIIINPLFDEALKKEVGEGTVEYQNVIECARNGSIQNCGVSREFKNLFKSALDIAPIHHVRMQAAFQKYTDNAVSKTINLKNESSKDEIRNIIIEAWKLGCKGLTIYRSGSRESEVLCLSKKEPAKTAPQLPMVNNVIEWLHTEGDFYESITRACIYKVQSGCGKFYVIIGHDGETPTTVFVEGDGTGGCQASMAALGRSLSAGLEAGTPPEDYVKQFSRVKCNTAMTNKKSMGKSCADIIGKCINDISNKLMCENGSEPITVVPAESNKGLLEPRNGCCDNPRFVLQEGCQVCLNCGASKCS